tara:strand:+ start:261 stop:743 length:483 start_codon:yes stop_codon:yes gene_type:complete
MSNVDDKATALEASTPTNLESKESTSPSPEEIKLAFKEFDVKKYAALKNAKKLMKDNTKNADFVCKMRNLLKSIDMTELNKYDENLVKFVIETVEHVFINRKSGEIKKSISIDLLAPYFDNNKELTGKFIELLLRDITKSTLFTRSKNRIMKFFFSLLNE